MVPLRLRMRRENAFGCVPAMTQKLTVVGNRLAV